MILLAVVVGAFLFYCFVDRRHKIIFFKFLAGLVLLIGLAGGGFYYYTQRQNEERKNWLSINYDDKDIEVEQNQKSEWVEQVWQSSEVREAASKLLPNITPSDSEFLKQKIFAAFLPALSPPDESEVVSDEELDAYRGLKSKWAAYCKHKHSNPKTELNTRRAKHQHKSLATIVSVSRDVHWCDFPEIREKFMNALQKDERALFVAFEQLRELALEKFYALVNESAFTTHIQFKVCNRTNHQLKNYSFYVSGFEPGHSTPNAVSKSEADGSVTHFQSDIIVQPNECSVITYSGSYKFYYDYEVTDASGEWSEEPSSP